MEKIKKDVYLAFDVGPTSVGWCVSDENGRVLEYRNRLWYGVRLFDDAAEEKGGEPKNLARRSARAFRRIIRRRAQRNKDFIRLCCDFGLLQNQNEFYDLMRTCNEAPVLLKCRGLQGEKLTNVEIMKCLFNYLQHRGFFYDIDEPDDSTNKEKKKSQKESAENDDKKSEKLSEKDIAKETLELLKTKLPSEILKEDFDKNGYYIGSERNVCFSNKDGSW